MSFDSNIAEDRERTDADNMVSAVVRFSQDTSFAVLAQFDTDFNPAEMQTGDLFRQISEQAGDAIGENQARDEARILADMIGSLLPLCEGEERTNLERLQGQLRGALAGGGSLRDMMESARTTVQTAWDARLGREAFGAAMRDPRERQLQQMWLDLQSADKELDEDLQYLLDHGLANRQQVEELRLAREAANAMDPHDPNAIVAQNRVNAMYQGVVDEAVRRNANVGDASVRAQNDTRITDLRTGVEDRVEAIQRIDAAEEAVLAERFGPIRAAAAADQGASQTTVAATTPDPLSRQADNGDPLAVPTTGVLAPVDPLDALSAAPIGPVRAASTDPLSLGGRA